MDIKLCMSMTAITASQNTDDRNYVLPPKHLSREVEFEPKPRQNFLAELVTSNLGPLLSPCGPDAT